MNAKTFEPTEINKNLSLFRNSRLVGDESDTEKSPHPMPPHVLMNFRGFPPGCGDSVADF